MKIREEKILKLDGGKSSFRFINLELKNNPGAAFEHVHYHEHVEILYGMTGVATVLVGDKTYRMKKGDMVVIYTDEPHDVISPDGDVSYYVIQFLPKMLYADGVGMPDLRYLLPMWNRNGDFSHLSCSDSLKDSGIDKIMDSIMREWSAQTYGYELVIQAEVMKLFVSILRSRLDSVELVQERTPPSLRGVFEKLIKKAQTCLCDLDVKTAAKYCNLSYSYFSRSFKQAYGMSFSEYMEILRLRESERMLLTTDKTVTEIAAELGFNSTSYFVERFRLHYHIPPHSFRSRAKNPTTV